MKNRGLAEREFATVVARAPDDLLSTAQLGFLHLARGDSEVAMPLLERVLASTDPANDELADRVRVALHIPQVLHRRPEEPRAQVLDEAKELANKSLERGYLKDALKYLEIAHENDPLDFGVMLKLGWTYNILKDDRDAVRWFDLARKSPDPTTAAEASRAYRNLHPQFERFRTTVWIAPTFSTRWHDLFAYAQVKTELRRLPHWWLHPYASVRFIGDSEGAVNVANLGPELLSERSVILGLGVATNSWRGANAWFEAGESLRYSVTPGDEGRVVPDYRGGSHTAKRWGNSWRAACTDGSRKPTTTALYVSRFSHDTLLYSQESGGVHVSRAGGRRGFTRRCIGTRKCDSGRDRSSIGPISSRPDRGLSFGS